MLSLVAFFFVLAVSLASGADGENWVKTSNGPWSKREGLMGVSMNGNLYISAGRDSYGVGFSSEIWRSRDDGVSWELASSDVFPGRAYHVHLVVNDCQYILGGQDLSHFFNDIYKSCDLDGEKWSLVTENAPWKKRAGAAGAVTRDGRMIITGGCYNKDDSPLLRSFYGDVWISADSGLTWQEMTPKAEWLARSGPRLVELMNNDLLLVAGEVGFTPETQLGDIWKSSDSGETWQLVTSEPGFSPRSGHGVVVNTQGDVISVIGGWPHYHDLWVSTDLGITFKQISNSVWNCHNEKCGKFDFWPLFHKESLYTMGGSAAYSTFGRLYQDTWLLNNDKNSTSVL